MIRMSGQNSSNKKKPKQQNETAHNYLLSKDFLLILYLRIELSCKAKISKKDLISLVKKLHLVLPELNCKRQKMPTKLQNRKTYEDTSLF